MTEVGRTRIRGIRTSGCSGCVGCRRAGGAGLGRGAAFIGLLSGVGTRLRQSLSELLSDLRVGNAVLDALQFIACGFVDASEFCDGEVDVRAELVQSGFLLTEGFVAGREELDDGRAKLLRRGFGCPVLLGLSFG